MSRFSRQIPFVSKAGQDTLAGTRFAIVGVGGLGTHVVQQLAFLGVKNFTLIDPDVVEDSNLNRFVIGDDSAVGKPKVQVARSFIEGVNPDALVACIQDDVRSDSAVSALQQVDYIVGCVDHDGPRFVLSAIAAVCGLPYMDLATDIADDRTYYGGRLIVCEPGNGCFSCFSRPLDSREIDAYLESAEQTQFRKDVYGQRVADHQETGPAVVSLNGVLASLGVSEILVGLTGIRKPRRKLEYRGTLGVVVDMAADWNPATCRICTRVANTGDVSEFQGFVSGQAST